MHIPDGFLTLPVAALLSGGCYAVLHAIFPQ